MKRRSVLSVSVAALFVTSVLIAQPNPQVPTLTSPQLVATGLIVTGESMAVDRRNNVYIVDRPSGGPGAQPARIARVSANGLVDLGFATGLGAPSELGRSPLDGQVYFANSTPILPVISSTLFRIDALGATQITNIPMIVRGLAFSNDGSLVLGGIGLAGPGVYRYDPTGSAAPQYLGQGLGSNATLEVMVDGTILIGEVNRVVSMPPFGGLTTPYYQYPMIGNSFPQVHSVARMPLNARGAGALIGVTEFTTLCQCGTGLAIGNNLQASNETLLASEAFSSPLRGLRSLADGVRQDIFWLTDQGIAPNAGLRLYRMANLGDNDVPGTLTAGVTPSDIGMRIFGAPSGNEPFILGAAIPSTPGLGAGWVPGIGILELDPFGPTYLPLFDGLGLFGLPDPNATTDNQGRFQVVFGVPAGTPPFQVLAQAGILSTSAPNGLIYLSNVEMVTYP